MIEINVMLVNRGVWAILVGSGGRGALLYFNPVFVLPVSMDIKSFFAAVNDYNALQRYRICGVPSSYRVALSNFSIFVLR